MSVWDVGLKLLKVSTGRQYPADASTYVKTSMVIKICEGQRWQMRSILLSLKLIHFLLVCYSYLYWSTFLWLDLLCLFTSALRFIACTMQNDARSRFSSIGDWFACYWRKRKGKEEKIGRASDVCLLILQFCRVCVSSLILSITYCADPAHQPPCYVESAQSKGRRAGTSSKVEQTNNPRPVEKGQRTSLT